MIIIFPLKNHFLPSPPSHIIHIRERNKNKQDIRQEKRNERKKEKCSIQHFVFPPPSFHFYIAVLACVCERERYTFLFLTYLPKLIVN